MALLFGILSYFIRRTVYDYSDTELCKEEATGECSRFKEEPDVFEICMAKNINLCRDHYYLGVHEEPSFSMAMKNTGTWILFMTNLVPISLVVSLEMVKFFQAQFMMFDVLMYDQE